MIKAKRAATAFALSFIVYLTPLVGPHALAPLGEVVWRNVRNLVQGRGDRTVAWIATDVGVALVAQIILFAIVYWLLRRPRWLLYLGLAVSFVPAVIVLNYAYMIAIPTRFLLEADTLAERNTWPLECTAKDIWIPQIAAPPTISRGAPIWTAEVNLPNLYALFEPAGCAVTKLSLAQSAAGHVTFVAGGRALYATTVPATGRQSFSVFDVAGNTTSPSR